MRLLIVDDDEVDRLAVRRALSEGGWAASVEEAFTAAGALEALRREHFDCALVDFHLPGADGFEVLRAARELDEPVSVVVLTGQGDEQLAVELMKAGALDYIAKSALTTHRLGQSLRYVHRVRHAERMAVEARRTLQRRAAQLQGLSEAAVALSAADPVDDLLTNITERARELTGAAGAMASMVCDGGWSHGQHAVVGTPASPAGRTEPWSHMHDLQLLVCERNEAVRLTSEELAARVPEAAGPDEVAAGGWLAAPLVARDGRNMGMLQLTGKDEGEFTAEDEAILVQLARMASVLLENAQLYEDARQAAVAREEVLAVVSHDLRTPLGVIGTATALLRNPDVPEATRASVIERVERNVERMNRLIHDLLEVARLDAGRLPIERRPVPVGDLLEEAGELMRPRAEERVVELVIDAGEPAPSELDADRERLIQVFQNLVDNALKFTPKGGRVSLEASFTDGSICFAVTDTGPGIPPEEQGRLFERFWQARAGRGAGSGGTGLGLAIARGIVEAHGGSIWVESEVGHGSSFRFTIPRRTTSSDPHPGEIARSA
ncbi:MAG TPA: ATP-binding protein [Thermoanaerobaculia bacterium]|nr:ATP-binding protein [Thermoanaerobaculia bacterium]